MMFTSIESLISTAKVIFFVFILLCAFGAAKLVILQVEYNYLKEQAEESSRKLHMYECITSKEFDGHSIAEASEMCAEVVL